MDSENDIYEMCRLCLAKEQVDVHIFEEENQEKQIFLKISTCLPIKISFDDKFPKKICTHCSCKLDAMYQFWNKSLSSESQLSTWLDLNSIENVSTPDNRLNSINLHSHIYVKEEPIDCLKTEHDIKLEVMEESYDDESYNQPTNEFPDQEASSRSKRKRDTSPECEINSDDDPLAQDTDTKNESEDHFKIVVIITKKGTATKLEYAYVPFRWVKDGFVFWPSKNFQALRDNPSSTPEPGWNKHKCKIKKDFIVGKEEALLWEEKYVNASCTESEETLSSNRQLRTVNNNGNKMRSNKTINQTNIDALFDNLISSQSNINAAASKNIGSEPIILSFQNDAGILVPADSDDEACKSADNVPVSRVQEQVTLNTIYGILQTVQERQQQIEENQLRMLEMRQSDNSSLKLTLDKMYGMIKNLHDGTIPRPTTSYEKPNKSEFASKFIFPINTVLDVQAFNSEIEKNADYKQYLINNFKTIGGTEGNEEGKVVAKNLLAILFTKEVLTNFSWTGISRTTGVEKKGAFHSYCGILNFFTEILILADSRWNATKNDNLFKMHILKHAKQINEASKKKKKLPAGRQEQSDKVPDSTDSDSNEI